MKIKTYFNSTLLFIILASPMFLVTSCLDNEDPNLAAAQEALETYLSGLNQDSLDAELQIIDDSLDAWGLSNNVLIEHDGMVRYIIHKHGDGDNPELNSFLSFNYSGKRLVDGFEFDAGDDLQAYLYQLIPGFQTTLPNVKNGTDLTMYVPSLLGYGNQHITNQAGDTIIPAKSHLIFDVELVDVE